VLAAVVAEREEGIRPERGSVELDAGDPPADALRILDADPVEAAAVAVADREALPVPGNARVDAERGAMLLEAQNRLEAGAVSQPAAPVYQVQPARPTWGGCEYTSAATAYGSPL
jgi:hypothetical protein